ncbi:alcohol dehydrogenase catalytic domain-containing protein [Nitriliruptoraceae bacterium ZYF776]|nr:alcohol dehydrogenase catalytic domain-containing protein [Profundirhabdus halotolerans]
MHRAGGPLELTQVDLAPPGPDEVLVRVRATGVCASDVHIVDGRLPKPLPVVPGHEASGEVVALGPGVDDLDVGAHVVLSILPRCLACTACLAGRTNHCAWAGEVSATGTLDGRGRVGWHLPDGSPLHHFNGVSAFADHVVVPRSGAVAVDPALPFPAAALLGCAVSTGVGAVRNVAEVRAGQSVAVFGCGGVGLSIVQGARMAGATRIVAVDVDAGSLALARRLGATDVVDARDGDVRAAVWELLPAGVDHAFDAIGRPASLEDAFAVTAAGGAAIAVGLYATDATVTIEAFPLIGERRLLGTYLGGVDPHVDVPLLAADVLAGRLDLDGALVTRPFAEVNDAIDLLRAGGASARQVLVFD